MRKCIGWIPNLTGDIFLINPFEKRGFHDIDAYKTKIRPGEYGGFQNDYDIRVKEKEIVLTKSKFWGRLFKNPFHIGEQNETKKMFDKICTFNPIDIDKSGLIQFYAETRYSYNISLEERFINII